MDSKRSTGSLMIVTGVFPRVRMSLAVGWWDPSSCLMCLNDGHALFLFAFKIDCNVVVPPVFVMCTKSTIDPFIFK